MYGSACKARPTRRTPISSAKTCATSKPYCDRDWDFPYKIEDLCFRLFTEAGFEWGGDWTNRKDYQHFEVVE